MGKEQILEEFLKLSPDDRQELIYNAIESLPAEYVMNPQMSPELRAELEHCYQEMLDHPERESTWKEASDRIRSKNKTNP